MKTNFNHCISTFSHHLSVFKDKILNSIEKKVAAIALFVLRCIGFIYLNCKRKTIEATPLNLQLNQLLKKYSNNQELDLTWCHPWVLKTILNLLKICDNIDWEWLKSLPEDLEILDLSIYNVPDEALKYLPRKLKILKLTGCPLITGSTFDQLPDLVELNLANCQGLEEENLAKLPKSVRHLNLSLCEQLNGSGFQYLHAELQSLFLSGCSGLSDKNFSLHHLVHLETLDLSYVRTLTTQSLDSLAPGLTSLDLSGWSQIVFLSLAHLKSLQKLDLTQCTRLKTWSYIPDTLMTIILKGCVDLSEVSFLDFPSNLRHLCLTECTQLTNKFLNYMKHCTSLESLDVSFCNQLEDPFLKEIPKLKNFNLLGCRLLTEEALSKLSPTIILQI